jgi:hypothetical protein
MRWFRCVTAEYTCSNKRCGFHRSEVSPTLSPFDLAAAAMAALPLWVVSLCEPWHFPWYGFTGILAGELLLVIVAGHVSSFVLALFSPNPGRPCDQCGAPVFHAGRHFDPLGATRPDPADIRIFIIFCAANLLLWILLARAMIWGKW